MLTAIRQWVIKTMMKGNTGVVQTLPKQEIIEMNVQITAERIMRNGINPNDLKTVGQVENVINQIEQPKVNVNPGLTSVKKADVLDMEGNKISEGSKIIGGKQIKPIDELEDYNPTSIDQKNLNKELMKTDNPFSDLVKTTEKGPKTLAEREADILAGMEKNNKEMVQRIRDRKKAELENRSLEDYVDDAGGVNPDDPRGIDDFIPDPEDMATGGRVGLLAGSVPKIPAVISALLKNKKKVNQAVNNIFPTGDYKLDAEMVAESIVELNPKPFKGMLYDDLDDVTRSEIYGAALSGVNQQNALMLQMKRATRPEKTLASMKEGKGINMSDPDIAKEFARFMKQTDPKGTKELEEKILLESFDPKRTKGNADGGRIGLKGGTFLKGLSYLKELFKKKPKKLETVNDFVDKRKFLKSMVGETEKNKKARQLAELKEAMEEARKNPGFKFKDIDVDKDIRPIFDQSKDRTLNAEGGRIGYADGTPSFEEYLKERGMIEKRENLERLKREFKEDMRRKNVMEQKQMAADGGRIGLKAGMTKRAFMKLMGGFGATVGAAKSGIFTGFGKGATKQVAKEVAQQTTSSTPPPYFFKLAEKIKMMGDDVTATTDRTIAKKLPSKDGKSEYLLEQDVSTGDTSIKKIYKEDDNMITDVEIMEFRKGEDVITKDGKAIKTPDEYEEVTEVNKRIYKDDYNASDYSDGINVDEIIKEVDDQAPPIKYASGGLAYMLGE